MGYILTNDNLDLLKIIYEFGGYTRIKNIQLLYPGISNKSLYLKLKKLEDMKYLKSMRLKTNSKKEQITYQITFLTCKLFNNPNSYFRKKHNEEYIYRALIKNYFLFSIYNKLGEIIIGNHDERILLFEEGNFNKELFPKKYNKNESFIHFEEMVIDFTKNKGRKLLFNEQLLYDDNSKNVIIIYVDEYYKEPKKQIIKLINKYINLINTGGNFKINFLVVTDNDNNRNKIYKVEIDKFLEKHYYVERISNKLLTYYKDLLLKFSDKNKHQSITESYKNGSMKEIILNDISKIKLERLNIEDNNIIESVKIMGENYIIDAVKQIVDNHTNIEESFLEIEKLFRKLFLLEYNKYINFGTEMKKKFEIKTYKIDEKIYQS